MSNLIKASDLAPTLSPMEQKVVLASRSVRVKEMTPQDLFALVVDQISVAVFTVGHNPKEKEELRALASSVCSDLVNKFPNLTKDEFSQAMNLGSRGEFKTKPDEILLVSIAGIYHWIKSYNEQVRREAVAKQRQFESKQEKKEWTEEDKIQLEKEYVRDCILAPWKASKESGKNVFTDPYGKIYDYFAKKGIFSHSGEEKRKRYIELSDNWIKTLGRSNTLREEWSQLEAYKSGQFLVTNIFHVRASMMTKEAFVKEYIDFLLETEQDLEEILNV